VYHALDQLHALPSVSYLAKIRNTDRKVGVAESAHGSAETHDDHKADTLSTGHH
jgi:hypothetical protein